MTIKKKKKKKKIKNSYKTLYFYSSKATIFLYVYL